MKRLRSFVLLTLFGGLAVILPVLLFGVLVRWVLGMARDLAMPLTTLLGDRIAVDAPWVFVIVMIGLLLLCFVTGLVVSTPLGAWLYRLLDEWLSKLAPGYRTVRATVGQLLGSRDGERLHGEVALVRVFGAQSAVRQVAIVTARHGIAAFTVYVPTAPLPTQGFIYHLPADCVELLPGLSIESAMRMVFACGAGAADLLGDRLTFKNGAVA